VEVEYDVPPPEDIPEPVRKRIDPQGEIPAFATFLRDCKPTFLRYFPTTYYRNDNDLYQNDAELLDAVENERMSRWAALKGWNAEHLAAKVALQKDFLQREKEKEKPARNLKRGSVAEANLGDNSAVTSTKKARTDGEDEEEEEDAVVSSPFSDFAPSTPRHQRRSSSLNQQWSPRASFYSHQREMTSPVQARQPFEGGNILQFVDNPFMPVTPDRWSTGTGFVHSPGEFASPNGWIPGLGQFPHAYTAPPYDASISNAQTYTTPSRVGSVQQGMATNAQGGSHTDFYVQGRQSLGEINSQNFGGWLQNGGSNNFDIPDSQFGQEPHFGNPQFDSDAQFGHNAQFSNDPQPGNDIQFDNDHSQENGQPFHTTPEDDVFF
jgi:hypothetical protein